MADRYSSPPVAPSEIVARWREKFPEPPAVPVELVVQRFGREEGKRARFEASAARVELAQWLESTGWKR